MTKRTRSNLMRGRAITPAIGREMARARWNRYHATHPDREPKFARWYPLEIGFRDKRSGECEFTDLRSVRQALRIVSLMLREWRPTPRHVRACLLDPFKSFQNAPRRYCLARRTQKSCLGGKRNVDIVAGGCHDMDVSPNKRS